MARDPSIWLNCRVPQLSNGAIDYGSSTIFEQIEVLWPNFSLDDPVVAGEEMLGQFNQFNKYLKARAEALK